ncbi:hypothetical protein FRC16_003962 [Serendipita sp. 398]|nr:hypothetical protein FRC16_003962 [Serendipita sp. 398]
MSSIGRLRAKILVLPGSEWNALMAKPAVAVTELLGEVRSLVIESFVSIPKEIPIICPNLTLLALHVTNFSWEKSAIEPVTLPDLSTLQIVVDREEDLQKIGRWKMPSLKYLELRMSSGFGEISFADFLQEVGKGLISLQIGDTGKSITLFDGIWSALPKVRYFGVSTLSDGFDMLPSPPQDHPLRTISNREPPDYNFWRREIIDVVDKWTRIECISDTHSWEDMDQEILKLERSENQVSEHYCKSDNSVCHQCIYDGNTRCEERNVRYEDAFGRTWAEYKQAADPTDSDSDSSSDFAPADTATETDSSSTSTSTPVTSAPTPSETVTSITLSFPADGSDPSIPPVNPGSSQPTPPPVVVVGIHFIPAAGGASAPAPSSSGEAPSPVVQVKRGMQKKIRRV